MFVTVKLKCIFVAISTVPPEQPEQHLNKSQITFPSLFFSFLYHTKPRNLSVHLLMPTGYVMHQQFNIQQLYALPTPYLCVLYLSENKHRLVPLTT